MNDSTNPQRQAISILTPPHYPLQLQSLRKGLIENALVRVDKCLDKLSRVRLKLKKDVSNDDFIDNAISHLELAMKHLNMLNESPEISNESFLSMHDETMNLVVYAREAIALAVAWKGSATSAARKKAIAKHMKDPRTLDKAFVKECWQCWRESPSKYRSKAAFARDMLDKVEHLESTKKIEDWCRKWEEEGKTLTLLAE